MQNNGVRGDEWGDGHGHSQFARCRLCRFVGTYYYGDEVTTDRRTNRINRAEILELCLEQIERKYLDGTPFLTWPFALEIGVWGHRVGHCLRWLEHIGILTRTKQGKANLWCVSPGQRSASSDTLPNPGGEV